MRHDFVLHTPSTAPEASQPWLEGARKAFGRVPNVLAVMAESPAALEAYLTLGGLFEKTAFDATERHVVLQAINAANACHYCTQAHGTLAVQVHGLDPELDRALRERRPLADPRLEALRGFADALVRKQGWPAEQDVADFLAAGYERRHLIEVILAAGFKTITNYLNHIADTPVDAAFSRLDHAA